MRGDTIFNDALRLARKAGWAPVAVVLLHAIGARLFGHEPNVDPVMHFLGGAAIAFFLWEAALTAGRVLGAPSILALDLIAFGLSVVTGLAWEFGEFLSDTFLGTHAHTSVGNTLRDLLLDMLGALAALGVLRILPSRRPGAAAGSRPGSL